MARRASAARRLPAVVLLAAVAAGAALVFREPLARQLPATWRIQLSAWRHGVHVDHDVRLAMRDGTRLAASLYTPRGVQARLPTVLVRLPYHRLRYREGYEAGVYFAQRGYAVLVEDLRGTGDSDGVLLPWAHAQEDGEDTLAWIARQPWSTGRVGTYGCSALGETQLVMARARHPAHAAMVASGAGGAVGSAAGRYAYFGVFEGGVFELASGFGWFAEFGAPRGTPPAAPFDTREVLKRLPVSSLVAGVRPGENAYTAFLTTPLGDPKWSRWGYLDGSEQPQVPALLINTWGDQTVGETLALAEGWRKDSAYAPRQKVVIAPGKHCGEHRWRDDGFGELRPRGEALDMEALAVDWFDHWLRDAPRGVREWPAYRFYMLGEDRWLAAESWPPAAARVERWYLTSGGHANSRRGDGALRREPPESVATDRFTYDPANPVSSRGGPICCTGNSRDVAGPVDQSDVETRDDVLVYTSEPLAAPLRIAGPLRAHLTVSSSAPDTDLVVRLVDVFPDGRALNMQEGALRLRYRDGFGSPRMMERGRRYDVVVDVRSIAWSLPAGHRLRVQVTSSSFPRLERNLNTGAERNADETRMQVAVNEIHHGAGTRSWLELPALPDR